MMAIFFPPRCAISSSKENSKSHPSFLFSTGLQDRESQKKTCSCPASFALFHQKHFINFVLTCFNWKRKKSVSTLLLYHLLSKVIYTSLRFIKIPVRVFTRKKFMLAWGKEKKKGGNAAKRVNTDRVTDLPSAISPMWPLGPAHSEAKKCWYEGKKSALHV